MKGSEGISFTYHLKFDVWFWHWPLREMSLFAELRGMFSCAWFSGSAFPSGPAVLSCLPLWAMLWPWSTAGGLVCTVFTSCSQLVQCLQSCVFLRLDLHSLDQKCNLVCQGICQRSFFIQDDLVA